MKATSRYVKVHYEDKVIFTERRKAKNVRNVAEVWRRSQGIWKDHPVFHGMTAKEIVEWLRGEDSDFRVSLDSSIIISHLAGDVHKDDVLSAIEHLSLLKAELFSLWSVMLRSGRVLN